MATESPEAPVKGLDAVTQAADRPDKLTDQSAQSATDWFLSDGTEESVLATLPINVAGPGQREKLVNFKIQVVDRDEIKRMRKQSEVTKGDGTTEVDDMEANLKIAVAGLVEPDLSKPENRKVRGQEYLDAADALRARFIHKPGLIDQIAGQIVKISGYNDKDVKEIRAAGN